MRNVIAGCDLSKSRPPRGINSFVSVKGRDRFGDLCNLGLTRGQLCSGVGLIGATGSGKTYLMKRLHDVIRNESDDGYSMLVVEAKDDFADRVRPDDFILEQGNAMGRSVKWNLFRDILYGCEDYEDPKVELYTRELVNHFFADRKNDSQKFFILAARELLTGVILAYIRRSSGSLIARRQLSNRGLKDFFLNFRPEDYQEILEYSPNRGALEMMLGKDTAENPAESNLQALGILAEAVTSVLNQLTDVFGEDGDFSIREFVGEQVGRTLYVNYDPAYKETQEAVYGTMIHFFLKEATSRELVGGHCYFLCDELSVMGKSDLPTIINIGRAKGLSCILGFQAIPQLYDIYGLEKGRALLAGLCTMFYFRPNDDTTADYLVNALGTTIEERMFFSPAGTFLERKEGHTVEKWELNEMQVGDCIVKMREYPAFWFRAG